MSITCSIPGCNGRNTNSKQPKLYRIPAVPIASSGFIHDLSNNRRRKWMAVLQNCGLTEENSQSYRVCSNHFADGKPAPTFDSKNPDWIPHVNLNPEELEELVVEKRKGRPRKKSITMTPRKNKSQTRSKSTTRAKTPVKTVQSRSKSVSRAKKPKDEKNDSPFVFVDIQKIKEGVSIADTVQTTAEQNKNKYRTLRTFGTQTNPNILPPIHWGRNKSKKQDDPRYRSTGVQVSTTNEEASETCLGGMIDYIRKQMLEFIFAPFGKNYKITECAIHLEKQITNENQETEKSVVIVQSNKLLSANWPLLETIAKSLDLHKKEKKKEKNNTGLVRTNNGKKETLDYLKTLLKSVENIDKPHVDVPTPPVTSPTVTPKITSVVSIGDLMNESMETQPKKRNSALRPLEVSTVDLPKANVSNRVETQTKTALKKAKTVDVFKQLGTSKVPKIILTKLPESVVKAARNGGTISVAKLTNPKDSNNKTNNCSNEKKVASILSPLAKPLLRLASQVKITPQLCLPNVTTPPLSTVKNIPLKLPEQKGIAGYIVLSKSGPTANPCVYVVPGAQLAQNQSKTPEKTLIDPTISRLFTSPSTTGIAPSVFPITSTPLVDTKTSIVDPKTLVVRPKTPVARPKTPVADTVARPKTPVARPKTPVADTVARPKTPVADTVPRPKTPVARPKTPVARPKTPIARPKTPTSPLKTNSQVETLTPLSPKNDSLRCPCCKIECKNGVEFIVHYKNCKGKRVLPTPMHKCDKCKKYYATSQSHACDDSNQLLHCNVCGRGFIKCSNLANHLKIHAEYSLWSYMCPQCPKKFETETLLQEHADQCEMLTMNKKTYPCKYCKKIFIIESRLEAHVKNVHFSKGNSPSTGRNVKVKCRRCDNVFDLKYYRSTHWKMCKPATESDEESAESSKKINTPDNGTRTPNVKFDTKIESNKGTFKTPDKAKKMTGIRSFPIEASSDDDLGASIEDQLQKMFQDDAVKSSCEQVKLHEDFEEKIAQNEINSPIRKRKLEEPHKSNDYDGLLEIKISKMDDGKALSNGMDMDEINKGIDAEVCLQSTFDMTDCLNEISFEEVDDAENYSDS